MLGMKPKEYRDGGTGNTIRFAIAESSLGSVLIASSEKGVCSMLIVLIKAPRSNDAGPGSHTRLR
jgi:hypothetical protein